MSSADLWEEFDLENSEICVQIPGVQVKSCVWLLIYYVACILTYTS